MTKGFDKFEPVPGCSDNLDPKSASALDPASNVNFKKMSAETVYPAEYQAMKKEWLAQMVQELGTSIGKRTAQTFSGKVERKWSA